MITSEDLLNDESVPLEKRKTLAGLSFLDEDDDEMKQEKMLGQSKLLKQQSINPDD